MSRVDFDNEAGGHVWTWYTSGGAPADHFTVHEDGSWTLNKDPGDCFYGGYGNSSPSLARIWGDNGRTVLLATLPAFASDYVPAATAPPAGLPAAGGVVTALGGTLTGVF